MDNKDFQADAEERQPPPYTSAPNYQSSAPNYQSSAPDHQSSAPNFQSSAPNLQSSVPGYAQPYPNGPMQLPMYPPMVQQQSTVIMQTAPTHFAVGRDPTYVRCPSCRTEVVTTVHSSPANRTHLWALILCLLGCWPCACVPYCMDECQTINHYCPVCNCYLGSRS